MSTTFDVRRWATQAGIQTTGGFAVIAEYVTMDELQRFAEIAIASAGFDAADMATAAAQGFRDGVASVSAGSEPEASRAFLERALSAMEGVIDVADRKTVEFDALRSCVIDLTLMLFKQPVTRTSPQEGMVGGWISVKERLPAPDEPVLACNGKWIGVAAWMSGDYLEPRERWQDEHSEFIEMMGPAVTHWMPHPPPPTTSAGSGKGD